MRDGMRSSSALLTRGVRGVLLAIALGAGATVVAAQLPWTTSLAEKNAWAKHAWSSPYGYDQTWSSLLRLLRVDLGYKILERDDKIGYVLFEYPGDAGVAIASIELLKLEDRVDVACTIGKYPGWHEISLLDKLARKMRTDYGDPPEKPRKEPDAGAPEASPDAS
jgi:hypothetical protein